MIEVLIVTGIIGVLSSIVVVAVNPTKQLKDAQDAMRKNNERQMNNALYQRLIDEWQSVSEDLPGSAETAKPICKSGITDDPSCMNLDILVPEYIAQIPVDLLEENQNYSGYAIYEEGSRPTIIALYMGEAGDQYAASSSSSEGSSLSSRGAFGPESIVADAGYAGESDDAMLADGTQSGRQHSMVTRIVLTFNDTLQEPIDYSAFGLMLMGTVVDVLPTAQVVGGKTVITVKFGSGASTYPLFVAQDYALNDGQYYFTVDGTKLRTSSGELSSSSDISFHRYFGDADGDRDTDGMDLNALRMAMTLDPNNPARVPVFDYEDDGDVDDADYAQFRTRYGHSLPVVPL